MANPSGRGGWAKGVSGNPGGAKRRHISDLSREARQHASLAIGVLVKICRNGIEPNRLLAAREILDRGYGRPIQMIDASLVARKLSEMSPDQLVGLEARLLTSAADDQKDFFH
jgi:hypothetical protein